MQMVPALQAHLAVVLVLELYHFIRLTPGGCILKGKRGAVFAGTSTPGRRVGWSGAIQNAVAPQTSHNANS
jgi:hypothetical protein